MKKPRKKGLKGSKGKLKGRRLKRKKVKRLQHALTSILIGVNVIEQQKNRQGQ
jgi:hypothetical protein